MGRSLTPESTHITSIADLTALFTSAVRFEWDIDVIREGRTDTRRLLVNADTAFSLTTSSPEADDVAAETFPGWPCCLAPRRPRRFHEIDFDELAFGVRAPASQRFTDSASTFTWQGGLPPVVAPPIDAPAGSFPVFVHVAPRRPGPIAVASFDERVALCEIFVQWAPIHSKSVLVIEAFDGLALVASQKFPVSVASPFVVRFATPAGVTSLLIRKLGTPDAADGDVELVRVRYRTVREELQVAIAEEKCRAGEDRVHGSGVLAWLPNRDYEFTVRVRITLEHERSGSQDATVEQRVFFRTKGLVGLNAVARVGDEIEPYVESCYPGPGGARLYRHESIAVAFTERFNILAPVNRTPSTTAEANQILEWVLAVEKVGGVTSFERISQTSPDWVVAHRNLSPPLPPAAGAADGGGLHQRRAQRAVHRSARRALRSDDGSAGRLQRSRRRPASLAGADPCARRSRRARWRDAVLGSGPGTARQSSPEARTLRRSCGLRSLGRVGVHPVRRQRRSGDLAVGRGRDARRRRSTAGAGAVRRVRRQRLAARANRDDGRSRRRRGGRGHRGVRGAIRRGAAVGGRRLAPD